MRKLCFLVILLMAFCCPRLRGQSTNASLTGYITDQTRAVVPEAEVIAINVETSLRYEARTSRAGSYDITNLPPGPYRIEVEKSGFKTVVKSDVILHVQDTLVINFEMALGSASEIVTVEGGAPLMNTESATVDTVVTREQVENMPLNGRSFQSLITLIPGTVLAPTRYGTEGQFSTNGQRTDANYVTVDGVSANVGISAGASLSQSAGGALPAFSVVGGTSSLVSVDAMQEFRIQTSTFAPEFGRTPGAQISIASRSGTNSYHGTAFDYLRNDALDANDWFANREGLPKPPLRQNDFGGVFGGPVRLPGYNGKDRTFFFVSYEGLRLLQPTIANMDVPTLAVRQAAVPSIAPLLNAFPLPNTNIVNPSDPGLVRFQATFSNPSVLNATSFRIDHVINNKITLFGRYNYAPSSNIAPSPTGGVGLNTIFDTTFTTQTITGGVTWSILPKISNEFRVNWSKTSTVGAVSINGFGGATVPQASALFPFPGTDASNALFYFDIFEGTNTIIAAGKNTNNSLQQLNFVDNISLVSGSHQLKFGLDVRSSTSTLGPRKYGMLGIFDSAENAASGTALLAITEANLPNGALVYQNFSLYAQDTYHVTQRFTLVYGVRWDVNPAPTGQNGFVPLPVLGLENLANPSAARFGSTGTSLWSTSFTDFAPRLGASYKLSSASGREIVLRAGAGIFYDLGNGISGTLLRAGSYPLGTDKDLFGVPFPTSGQDAQPIPIGSPPSNLTNYPAFDQHLKLPRTYQWNVALEGSLGANQAVTLTYVGSVGRDLLRVEEVTPNNPTFSSLDFATNTGESSYNALQVQFKRRFVRGLQALASYTFSHSIDNISSDTLLSFPEPSFTPSRDRGPSDFDIRHSFAGSLSYELPSPTHNRIVRAVLGSWALDGTVRAYSAPPVDILVGGVPDQLNSPTPRPDFVVGQPLYLYGSQYPGGKAFNPDAFTAAAAGLQGDVPRNALRGFAFLQFDQAFRRQFRLGEKVNLQFRAEFFNIFNHPNFAPPASDLTQLSSFGQSQSMYGASLGSGGVNGGQSPIHQVGGARSTQVALKLQF